MMQQFDARRRGQRSVQVAPSAIDPGHGDDRWPTGAKPPCPEYQDLAPIEVPTPFQPLHARLRQFLSLSVDETSALDALPHRPRALRPEETLVHEGEGHDHVYLVLRGFAYRYKLLANGHRQILGFLLPGDLCDIEFADGIRPDHSVAALNDAVVATIPVSKINETRRVHPNIDTALSIAASAERSILRHWLLNVGQRNAVRRITHLLCEMAVRLSGVGHHNSDGSVDVPVSQAALADTTGMTTVHVNRSLQRLRRDGLIELYRNRLKIIDPERLADIAGFDGDYLRSGRCPD